MHTLVLFYSRDGGTLALAREIARGAESQGLSEAQLRTVPALTDPQEQPEITADIPHCSLDELRDCSALALGSPTRFGNMAAPLKQFIDGTGGLWSEGALVDKPAMVFTATGSLHGGQESTLLSMALPLLHHGMVLAGVPYPGSALGETRSGGTPYGASHVSSLAKTPDATELKIAFSAGQRLARLGAALAASN